jgi:hypothetical protein
VSPLEINKTLDRVDTPSFFGPTAIAGGPETVRSVLLETPELTFLIRHRAEAVPAIRRRLERAGGVKHEETHIAYFLVLEKAREKRALPDLLRYIESLPDRDRERVESPWHPFRYAVEAVIALTAIKLHIDSTEALFAQRHALVAKARAALEHEQDQRHE